jgi:hypothetical protein
MKVVRMFLAVSWSWEDGHYDIVRPVAVLSSGHTAHSDWLKIWWAAGGDWLG